MWKKFCVVLVLLSLLSLPLSAESEIEVPELEPETEYVMTGEDIMTLYQTIRGLKSSKNEIMKTLERAETYLNEYEKENKKLTFQNNFLVGGITVSVGVVVVGAIVWAFTK